MRIRTVIANGKPILIKRYNQITKDLMVTRTAFVHKGKQAPIPIKFLNFESVPLNRGVPINSQVFRLTSQTRNGVASRTVPGIAPDNQLDVWVVTKNIRHLNPRYRKDLMDRIDLR